MTVVAKIDRQSFEKRIAMNNSKHKGMIFVFFKLQMR